MSSISGGSGAKNFITDAGTAVAVNSTISVVGAGGATTSASGNTITVTAGGGGGGITTIDGDSGSATGATVTFTTNELANTTAQFTGSGATISLSFADANLNLIIGEDSSASTLTSATSNVGFGYTAFNKLQSGNSNVGVGYAAFHELISGNMNCGFGQQPLYFLTSGSYNTAIGAYQTGINYAGSESSNILLQHPGVVGESHVMRLGETGSGDHQVNTTYIAGIAGVSVSNTQMVTIDSTTGQMGSQSIPTGLSWSAITADQTAAVNHGYICNKAGTLALALPASSSVGDIIELTGVNTALGWQITQGTGQQIFFGTSSTTLGVSGTLSSTATRDSLKMVCVVADLTWNIVSSTGNFTVV